MNRRHAERRQNEAALQARIQSFELAYRMQMEATDAFDVEREPKHVQDAYGSNVEARQLLIARRLVERGVRYVQVWHGQGQPWDSHDDLRERTAPSRVKSTRPSPRCSPISNNGACSTRRW